MNLRNKKYIFDEFESNLFMIPFDKRGEWDIYKEDENRKQGEYDKYLVDRNINTISFENPQFIEPEPVMEGNIKLFSNYDLLPVSLGDQVLRVETACVTLLGILKYELGHFEGG